MTQKLVDSKPSPAPHNLPPLQLAHLGDIRALKDGCIPVTRVSDMIGGGAVHPPLQLAHLDDNGVLQDACGDTHLT